MPITNLLAAEMKTGKLTYKTVNERVIHYKSLQPPTLDRIRVHVTIYYTGNEIGRFVFDQGLGPIDTKFIEEQICGGRYVE